MNHPIVEIRKDSKDYPKCFAVLGDYAPDYILAKGNVSILTESIAAIISNTEQTEDNAVKVGRMFKEVPTSQYHYIYDIEQSVGKTALDYTSDGGSSPIIVFEDLNDEYPESLTETNIHQIEEILEDGGLLISFHYDDSTKWEKTEAELFMIVALSEIIAVPLCSKTDIDIRKAMDKAEELGKKVLINKEEYINLNK